MILAVPAVMMLPTAGAMWQSDVGVGSLGSPHVVMQAADAQGPAAEGFDHSGYDRLLKQHVNARGWVDYKALKADPGALDTYIARIGNAPFEKLGRNEKLALLINAYNAFTLRLILDYYPVDSIKDIPAEKRWNDERWRVGGHVWSLDQIEHEQIRPKFKEPRIHFALVCAAIGCPPLRSEAYVAERIDAQLEDQARHLHSQDRWFRFDEAESAVFLTALYDWYGDDFKQAAGTVLEYVARYVPAVQEALDEQREIEIHWLDYDWRLNSRQNAATLGLDAAGNPQGAP